MDTLTHVLTGLRAEIHRRHRHQLRCIGCRVDTDDLYQTVCIKAWKARSTCRGRTAAELRNWVMKIAANECRSLLDHHLDRDCRTIKRSTGEPQPWQHFYRDDPADRLIEAETHVDESRRAREAMERLTPKRRQAVEMRYLNGWAYDRIASQTGVKAGHARAMASEGVRSLRAMVHCAQ